MNVGELAFTRFFSLYFVLLVAGLLQASLTRLFLLEAS